MEHALTRDHVLAVLYDMANVVGGEVRVRPLVTRVVQRLLYHTSFPVGLALLAPRPIDEGVAVHLEAAVGDYGLASRVGDVLTLPAPLVHGGPAVIDDPAFLAALPVQPRVRGVCVRLPVGTEGVILLIAPELPRAELQPTQVFPPVMANLARAIVLCRSHEAHAAALVAERDAARLGLARFRAAVDIAADLVFVLDAQTQCFVDVNGTAETTLGASRAALVDRSLSDFAVDLDRERLDELFQAARTGRGPSTVVATLRTKDAARMPVEIRFSSFEPPGDAPLVIAAARDLTHRRFMEAQLQQAQKLEGIGRLAGGVAHDFNNLLTVILAGAAELLAHTPQDDPRMEELREIEAAGQRAATLTKQLLIFSRKSANTPTLVDLQGCVDGMVRMLRRLIGESIELVSFPPAAPAFALVDAGQLEQVILNLAVNARDAMPSGGHLTIEVSHALVELGTQGPQLAPPGRYSVIAVSDTGVGMPDEVRAHLFEPFFTTKEPGRGTGLGLSTVYGIVHQAGGHLCVTSAPGRGSRFEVWLPEAKAEPARSSSPGATVLRARGTEVILVVEDERLVREIAARTLERAGYRVLTASHGGEALEIAQGDVQVDLVVTDVVMPRMGGLELARQLSVLQRSLRVLFVSGYSHDLIDAPPGTSWSFLAKPYDGATLLAAVRAQLDARVA